MEMYGSGVSDPAQAGVPCSEQSVQPRKSRSFLKYYSADINPALLPTEPHIQSMTLLFKFLLSLSKHIYFRAESNV